MIRLLFVTLALVISATLADKKLNDSVTDIITWNGGENMVWWVPNEKNLWMNLPEGNPSMFSPAKRTAIYKNYAFLTYSRSELWSSSSPITLAQMNLEGISHRQHPFPNLAMQKRGNCSALQDVIDIFIDPRGLLWVLDTGRNDNPVPCTPKIVAFNAATGEVKRTIKIRNSRRNQHDTPQFSRMVVYYDQNYDGEVFVYVSDIKGRNIFVISGTGCIHSIKLPGKVALNSNSIDITLNLIRDKIGDYTLLINDERQQEMSYLRPADVPSCSELLVNPIHKLGPSNGITLLGNDHGSFVYFCSEKMKENVVYKFDALSKYGHSTIVYDGGHLFSSRHVVPGYESGNMHLLEMHMNLSYGPRHSFMLI